MAGRSVGAGTPGSWAPMPGADYYGGILMTGPGWGIGEPAVGWKIPNISGTGPVYCITAGANPPGMTYNAATAATSLPNAQTAASMIALFGQPGNTDAEIAEVAAEIQVHVARPASTSMYSGLGSFSGADGTTTSKARADAHWAYAASHDFGGAYGTPTFSGLVSKSDSTTRAHTQYTGTVHVPGAGAGVTVTLGFNSTQGTVSATKLVTNASGDATFRYTVAQPGGTMSFTASVVSAGAPKPVQYTAQSNGGQTMFGVLGASNTTRTGKGEASVSATIDIVWWKYTIGDQNKAPVAGAVFSKVVDATNGTTIATGLTSKTSKQTLPGVTPGHTLVWTETTAPPEDYINGAFTIKVPANAADGYEIALGNPKIPLITVSSQVLASTTPFGVRLSDAVEINGDDGESGTLDSWLKFVPGGVCDELTAQQLAEAAVVGTYHTPIPPGFTSGAIRVDGPVPSATQAGAWAWQQTVTVTPSGAVATSAYGAPGECAQVTVPSADTSTLERYGTPGDVLSDSVTVAGVTSVPAVTSAVGTFDVRHYFRPFANDSELCPRSGTPDGRDQWREWIAAEPSLLVATDTFELLADGSATALAEHAPAEVGCGTFEVSYTPVALDGEPTPAPVIVSPAGAENEGYALVIPSASTTLSRKTSASDSMVRFADKAQIRGTHGVPTTLIDYVLGPQPADAMGICLSVTFDDTQVAGRFDPITVEHDQTVETNTLTFPKSAADLTCYLAVESLAIPGPDGEPRLVFSADLGSEIAEMGLAPQAPAGSATPSPEAASSPRAKPSAQPKITTEVRAAQVTAGGLITDLIKLWGTGDRIGTVTGVILGPVAPNAAGNCDAADFTSAPIAGRITPIHTVGDGEFTSSPFATAATGCFNFVESWADAATGKTVVSTRQGEMAETFLVTPSRYGSAQGSGAMISTGFAGASAGRSLAGVCGGLALIATGLVIAVAGLARQHRVRL
ncbi:MAG: hypothetical protein FWD74_00350 [Actinomycetia bacterium]|nr:hypothetical protein [Actinomycetes bacterium]